MAIQDCLHLIFKPQPFINYPEVTKGILPHLISRLPPRMSTFVDPFVGGGSLLWCIPWRGVDKIIISDLDKNLMDLYRVVKSDHKRLSGKMLQHDTSRSYYISKLGVYNSASFLDLEDLDRASISLYLLNYRDTALARILSKHSPLDSANLARCAGFLSNVDISEGDFKNLKYTLNRDSFVYLDPPGDMELWGDFKTFVDYVDDIGAYFMLSTFGDPSTLQLFEGYFIETIDLPWFGTNCSIVRNYGYAPLTPSSSWFNGGVPERAAFNLAVA